jgi:hypothetical protein
MVYFANVPAITVDFTIKGDSAPIVQTIQDITTTIGMNILPLDLETLCFRYMIRSGDMPETLSQKYYGSIEYDWTILYINGIANMNNEWPLNEIELMEYVSLKYGSTNINAINSYQKLPEGVTMDQSFIIAQYGSQYVFPVTNYNFEDMKNDQKRYIRIVKPENLTDFVTKYNAALAQ